MSLNSQPINNDNFEFIIEFLKSKHVDDKNATELDKFKSITQDLQLLEKKLDDFNNKKQEFNAVDKYINSKIEPHREIIELFSGKKENYLQNFKTTVHSFIEIIVDSINYNEQLESYKDLISITQSNISNIVSLDEIEQKKPIIVETQFMILHDALISKNKTNNNIDNLGKIFNVFKELSKNHNSNNKIFFTKDKLNNISEDMKSLFNILEKNFDKIELSQQQYIMYVVDKLNHIINIYDEIITIENNKEIIEFNVSIGKEDNDLKVIDGNYVSKSQIISKNLDELWYSMFNINENIDDYPLLIIKRIKFDKEINTIINLINKLKKVYIFDFKHYNFGVEPVNEQIVNIINRINYLNTPYITQENDLNIPYKKQENDLNTPYKKQENDLPLPLKNLSYTIKYTS